VRIGYREPAVPFLSIGIRNVPLSWHAFQPTGLE
jgi:hypothetical protein